MACLSRYRSAARLQRESASSMASDLPEMASDVPQNNTEASVLPNDDGNGLSQGTIWPEGLPTLAPWSNLSWGLFLPLVFAGNVVVATLAWIIVGFVMR